MLANLDSSESKTEIGSHSREYSSGQANMGFFSIYTFFLMMHCDKRCKFFLVEKERRGVVPVVSSLWTETNFA